MSRIFEPVTLVHQDGRRAELQIDRVPVGLDPITLRHVSRYDVTALEWDELHRCTARELATVTAYTAAKRARTAWIAAMTADGWTRQH